MDAIEQLEGVAALVFVGHSSSALMSRLAPCVHNVKWLTLQCRSLALIRRVSKPSGSRSIPQAGTAPPLCRYQVRSFRLGRSSGIFHAVWSLIAWHRRLLMYPDAIAGLIVPSLHGKLEDGYAIMCPAHAVRLFLRQPSKLQDSRSVAGDLLAGTRHASLPHANQISMPIS